MRRLTFSLIFLLLLLSGCKDLDEERRLRCLAYADTVDEVMLVLRVEREAWPLLLEELTVAQGMLRREIDIWPTEQLLTARRLIPDTDEARQTQAEAAVRLGELRAALLLEVEELLAAPPEPEAQSERYEEDLRLVTIFNPEERLAHLLGEGLSENEEALLDEYTALCRTEDISWHEFYNRLSGGLTEYTAQAAALRRTNHELAKTIEEIFAFRRELEHRENPFAEGQ
ncbi:hypothetical protein K8R78_04260 [bacterium]|nr:hypothetical protein [bacterium]